MKKTCILALSLFCIAAFAQPRFEYDIHYGLGSSETGLNNVAGIAAAIYPFSNNLGFSVGVEYSSKERKRTKAFLEGSQVLEDSEGDTLVFKHRFHNHEEIRTATALQIPILLRYTKETYYISGGLKIGIPQTTQSKTSYSALDVEGYYPEMDYTFDNLPFQGFGRSGGGSFKSKFDSDLLVMLAFEYGAVFVITDNMRLMMGVFVESSLNNGFDDNFGPRVEWLQDGNTATSQVNDMSGWKTWNPWAVGVQFKFSFTH